MDKKIGRVLLIALLIVSVTGLTLVIDIKKNLQPNEKLDTIKSELFFNDVYCQELIIESCINNNKQIENLLVDWLYKDISKDKPVLIFRYSALNCDACIEYGKQKLKEHFDNYEENPFIKRVVSNYPSISEDNKENLIDLKKKNMGLLLENSNLPFFCILKGNQIIHVFIPDKGFPKYTDLYLKEIKSRYFENN